MKQPQRTQPSQTAPSGPNALSLTSPQSALCNVPQVLERSTRSLADAKKCTGAVTGPGVLVKLYPVGDLWIVGSPHTKRWIPSKVDDMRTANANAEANDKNKASQPAKPRSVFAHKAKAQLISEKAATQKHLRSRTQRAEKVTEQQVQEAQDESDKMNTEPEEEEDEEEGEDTEEEDAREEDVREDDVREDDVREEDAGEEDAAEEDEEEKEEEHAEDEDAVEEDAGEEDAVEDLDGDVDDSEEGGDLEEGPDKDAVMEKENGDGFEEQDDNGHSEPSKQAETAEADKEEGKEYGSKEDLAGDERAKRQQEAKGQEDAGREVDGCGEETTSDKARMNNETRGDDNAIQVGQREEHEDHGDKGSVEVHSEAQEVRELVEQRVAANHPSGAWESWAPGHASGREGEAWATNSKGGEGTIEADDGSGEGKQKRDFEGDGAMGTSTLEEYPKKRNKSTQENDESDAVMEDLFERDMETPLRPTTPSPMFPTLSPGLTIKTVRQTSVVPGFEDTENAVWDAAKRDSVMDATHDAHHVSAPTSLNGLRDPHAIFRQHTRAILPLPTVTT